MAVEQRLRSISKLAEQAQTALRSLSASDRQQREDDFQKLEATLGYVTLVFERTDPVLLSDAAHAEFTRLLEQITGNPVSVAANPAGFADALIGQAVQLPPAQDRDLEQAAKQAASSFRRSASQHINAVGDQAGQLRARLTEIASAAEEVHAAAKENNETAVAELRSQLESIHSAADAARKQVEELTEGQAAAFEDEQSERAKASKDDWTAIRDEIQARADELVYDLARMRDDAQGLVGAVSAASTANHFRDDAKRERISYRILLSLTVVSLSVAVVVAALAAAHPESELQRLITKLGVSAALVAFAVFTGARARDHRAREQRSQDKELDMRAFGPFIERLPPKDQARERILMARRFFGRSDNEPPVEDSNEVQLLSSDEEIEIAARDLRQHDRA